MTLQRYIGATLPNGPKAIEATTADAASVDVGCSQKEFCDAFAADVAKQYLYGSLSSRDADTAMNALSGYFFRDVPPRSPVPVLGFSVFDEGARSDVPENEIATRRRLDELRDKLSF